MTDFPFRIVGFDLDGTLLDTGGDLGMALNHVLTGLGRPAIALGEVPGLIGGGARMLLERGLARTGGALPEADLAPLHAELIAYYSANIARHTRPYPGAEAMLDALAARGVTLAVVTNKLEHLAVEVLEAVGLAGRFATIIGGDTLGPGRSKPAPDLLLEMARRLGDGPAAYVGDTTYDTRAAAAAGLPCVAVSFGFNDEPVASLGADAVIDHFDGLVPTLEALAVVAAG
ncbi:HAD-IA family hydrolase [Novosphingobium bradum]|uniref:Phosphoglycolate phosphatase n=1 Tax=Novosphingobium bradum TaxID=1737444 RepID=A0ABV7IMW6_9SPHN